jgi:uncharacterized glyoxalase superfamily protein PhnB
MILPEGYQRVMPYLIVKDAAGLFTFMQDIFQAKEKMKAMNDDGSLMHGEIQVGDSTIMIAEASGQWPVNNAGIFIYVPDVDETYKKSISAGCTSINEPANMDYGRSCGVKDPFGNIWWITSPL